MKNARGLQYDRNEPLRRLSSSSLPRKLRYLPLFLLFFTVYLPAVPSPFQFRRIGQFIEIKLPAS